jgi:hypothetical protein
LIADAKFGTREEEEKKIEDRGTCGETTPRAGAGEGILFERTR